MPKAPPPKVLTGPPGPPPKAPPRVPPGAEPSPKKVAAPHGSKPQKRGPPRRPGSTRRLTADHVRGFSSAKITQVASGSGESVLSPPGFSTKQLTAEIATLRQYVAELEVAYASLAGNSDRIAELEAENAALKAEALRVSRMAPLPPVPSKPPPLPSKPIRVDADRFEELEAENERLQNENDELLLEMELIHDGNAGADDSPRLSRKDSDFFTVSGSPSSSASPTQRKSATGDWSAGLAGFGLGSSFSAGADPVARAKEALALEGRNHDSVAFRRAETAMDGAQPILTITVIKKHKLRGKYNRDFALFSNRIATLNPKNGQITNAWDLCDIKVRYVNCSVRRTVPHTTPPCDRSLTPPPPPHGARSRQSQTPRRAIAYSRSWW